MMAPSNQDQQFMQQGIEQGIQKTEEDAMNKIDSIERERIKQDNANIQRIDNQVKR